MKSGNSSELAIPSLINSAWKLALLNSGDSLNATTVLFNLSISLDIVGITPPPSGLIAIEVLNNKRTAWAFGDVSYCAIDYNGSYYFVDTSDIRDYIKKEFGKKIYSTTPSDGHLIRTEDCIYAITNVEKLITHFKFIIKK